MRGGWPPRLLSVAAVALDIPQSLIMQLPGKQSMQQSNVR
jgi:hypothetical protein